MPIRKISTTSSLVHSKNLYMRVVQKKEMFLWIMVTIRRSWLAGTTKSWTLVSQELTPNYFTPKLSQLSPKMCSVSRLNPKMYPSCRSRDARSRHPYETRWRREASYCCKGASNYEFHWVPLVRRELDHSLPSGRLPPRDVRAWSVRVIERIVSVCQGQMAQCGSYKVLRSWWESNHRLDILTLSLLSGITITTGIAPPLPHSLCSEAMQSFLWPLL